MHPRPWRRTGLTSLIIGTAVLAAACSPGGAASAPAATPEPAAVSGAPSVSAAAPSTEPVGGSITVYNAQHESLTQAWVDEFTKQTGVQVTLRNGDDTELGNLLVQEGDASPADVFLTENSPAIALVEKAGLFAPVDQATLDQVPAAYRPSTGAWTGIAARSTVFAYNPTMLADDQLPASLLDLQEAAWKGRWAASPSGADFQAIVSALLALEGQPATEAWLGGHEDQLHGLPGKPDRDGRRERRRDPRRRHLPLLLVRRPGQHQERTARTSSCTTSRTRTRAPSSASRVAASSSRARTRLRHRRS